MMLRLGSRLGAGQPPAHRPRAGTRMCSRLAPSAPCDLLCSPWAARPWPPTMAFADFCTVTARVTACRAVGVEDDCCRFIACSGQHAAALGPWYSGVVRAGSVITPHAPQAVQISPDKNANCRCTSAAFTVGCVPVGFAAWCQLASHPSALYAVSFRRLAPLALGLPSDKPSRACPCRRLVVMLVVKLSSSWYSHRGLSPHKFSPMLGVHPAFERTANGGAARCFNRGKRRRCLPLNANV
jgi:hypothetical protein